MSNNFNEEISEIIRRNNARRQSLENIDAIAEKLDSTDHPALHKNSLTDNTTVPSERKAKPAKKAPSKKDKTSLKTKTLGIRITESDYEEFSKIAAGRHLTVAMLGRLLVDDFLATIKEKK